MEIPAKTNRYSVLIHIMDNDGDDDNDHNDDDEDDSNDEDALISECQCQYTGGAAGAIVIVNIGGFALTQSNGSAPLQVFDYLL